jgi:hypothetical protein
MEEVTRDALVSVVLFAAIFGMVYVYLMTRHRERMTILEKNLTTSPFTSVNNTALLKYGIIWLGISAGIIAGYILYDLGFEESFSYASMVFLFSGISMIIAFFVAQKHSKS